MNNTKLSLGCHNLTGGSSYLRSARLVHCALDLGIRRFDVAPSYGFGTAETTLSAALGARRLDPAIEITTKYGILPPRVGWIAAWMREPYRALHLLHNKKQSVNFDKALPIAASSNFTGTAQGAVETSLRVMRLERIGVYLSHERLKENLAERFGEDMANLLRRGLIGKAGCSGDLANVKYMLGKASDAASVAQVSVIHHDAITHANEIRLFNLGSVARRLVTICPYRQVIIEGLRDALPGRKDLDEIGRALAAVLTWAKLNLPHAILILNASSASRFAAVINASGETSLSRWIQNNPHLMENRAVPRD